MTIALFDMVDSLARTIAVLHWANKGCDGVSIGEKTANMMNMGGSMKRHLWNIVFAVVLGAGLMVAFFSLFESLGPKLVKIEPVKICSVDKEDCQVDLPGGGRVVFNIHPKPVPATDPFSMRVELEGFQAEKVAVDFSGITKPTAFKRPYLKASTKEGVYVGTTDLTHCKDDYMDWRATILLERGKETFTIPFHISTKRDLSPESPSSEEKSIELADKPKGGDFQLTTTDGPVKSESFRGKFLFVYLGYTFCPDICPTTLSALGNVMKSLTPEELADVETLFISVDPERDSMSNLKKYVQYFHPKMKAATSNDTELRRIAKQYGAAFSINKKKPDSKHYAVDHSGETYLIDPDGKWVETFRHGTPVGEFIEKLRSHRKDRGLK